jgi:hypothetical protein
MIENPIEKTQNVLYNQNPIKNEFSTSQYFFGLAYLRAHKKEKETSFPKVNPQKEDFSRLVILLEEFGFSLD